MVLTKKNYFTLTFEESLFFSQCVLQYIRSTEFNIYSKFSRVGLVVKRQKLYIIPTLFQFLNISSSLQPALAHIARNACMCNGAFTRTKYWEGFACAELYLTFSIHYTPFVYKLVEPMPTGKKSFIVPIKIY